MRWIVNNYSRCANVKPPQTFLLTNFTDGAVKALHSCVGDCFNSGQPILPIYIESSGGAFTSLSGILSVMDYGRSRGLIFPTVVSGHAESAGAIVFCYGDTGYRFIGSFGSIMLHNCQVGGSGKLQEVHSGFSKVLSEETILFEKISRHLKKPKDWLNKNLEKKKNYDWHLTAEECIKENIASEIKTPTFVLQIEEKYLIA